MTVRIPLPAKLDSAAARALAGELAGQDGADAELDAAETGLIGAAGAEILLAAAATWAATGKNLRLINLSDPVRADIALLGLDGRAPFAAEDG